MPTRLTRWLIVLFWLATMGWYFRQEVLPYWTADAAPAYAVDLADEAGRTALQVSWTLNRRGQKPTTIRTSVDYHDSENEFSLNCTMRNLDLIQDIKIEKFHSSYRVNRWGRVVETSTEVTIGKDKDAVTLNTTARVVDKTAVVTTQIRSPWGNLDPPPEYVKVDNAGSLNPLHPVHKLRNVRLGQTWVQPLSDPLAEAQRIALFAIGNKYTGVNLSSFSGPMKSKTLIAEVTGPKQLEWHDQMHDCHVINYRGDGHRASIWVRIADGWVLRQEAAAGGDEWTLQRD